MKRKTIRQLLSFLSIGILVCTIQQSARCQDSLDVSQSVITGGKRPTQLSIRVGPGNYSRQDQIFSPFVHHDWSFVNVGLNYRWGQYSDQFIDFEFGSYNPSLVPTYEYNDDDQTYPHSFTLVNLTYALGKEIFNSYTGESNTRIITGGFFEADVEASTYNFAWLGTFGYLAPFSLGAWGEYQHNLGRRNSVSARLMLPLVSWVARSPYLASDDEFIENNYTHSGVDAFFNYLEDGELQTLNRIQQLEFNAGYKHSLSEKWSLGGLYEFRFMHSNKPLNFLSYRHTFYIQLFHTL